MAAPGRTWFGVLAAMTFWRFVVMVMEPEKVRGAGAGIICDGPVFAASQASGAVSVLQLAIPDVKVLTPRRFGDNRGWFTESWSRKVLDVDFCQDNMSLSAPRGTVRGLQRSRLAGAGHVHLARRRLLLVLFAAPDRAFSGGRLLSR